MTPTETTPSVSATSAPAATTPAQTTQTLLPSTTVESPVATTPVALDPDLSSKFAALARQEKANSTERRRLEGLAKKYGPIEERLGRAKEDPLGYLEAGGVTIEQLIQAQLKAGKAPTAEDEVLTIKQKLEKIEAEREAEREASKQQSINKSVQDFKDKIKAHTDSDLDKYELINVHGAHDRVFDVCAQYWEDQKDLEPAERKQLDIAKAADLVEDEIYQSSLKFKDVKKYRKLYTPETTSEPKDINTKATDTLAPQTEPTLTNRGTTPSAPNSKLLSRELAIKQIAAQYDGKR